VVGSGQFKKTNNGSGLGQLLVDTSNNPFDDLDNIG
jgi:hypothetical protein